jgi:hypothetical protein
MLWAGFDGLKKFVVFSRICLLHVLHVLLPPSLLLLLPAAARRFALVRNFAGGHVVSLS